MALEHLEQHLHLQSQQEIIEEDQPELSLEIPIFLRSEASPSWFVFYLEIITLQPE